jgi:hypothetical protein
MHTTNSRSPFVQIDIPRLRDTTRLKQVAQQRRMTPLGMRPILHSAALRVHTSSAAATPFGRGAAAHAPPAEGNIACQQDLLLEAR